MAGMVGRHMAEAIGKSASDASEMMFRSAAADSARSEKQADTLEKIKLDRQLQGENQLALREAINEGKNAGGSHLSADAQDEMTAGLSGTDVPTVRKTRHAVQTGDWSAFKTEAGDYPPGFEEQISAKTKALYAVHETVVAGKDGKDIAEGRHIAQGTEITNAVIAGNMDPAKAGRAVAAGEGKDLFGGTESTVFDKFGGASTVTGVGNSVIAKNLRPPPDVDGRAERTAQLGALTQERIAADNQMNDLRIAKQAEMKSAYSTKAKATVTEAYAKRETELAARQQDLVERIKKLSDGGAPAATAPAKPTASRGFKVLRD